MIGFVIAVAAALVVLIVAGLSDVAQFVRSYLVAWLFWVGVSCGAFSLTLMHHLSGGRWGLGVRRIGEAAGLTLPFLGVLGIPLLLHLPTLYPWDRPEAASDPILRHEHAYMNEPAFVLRYVAFFLLWTVMAAIARRWSVSQERSGDPVLAARLQVYSGPFLVAMLFSVTMAHNDWMVSLVPHWYSTVLGLLVWIGQLLCGMAFVVVVQHGLGPRQWRDPDELYDQGSLILTFVIGLAYLTYSQWIVTWSGNLPGEIVYFRQRLVPGWQELAGWILVLEMAVPFGMLIFGALKRDRRRMVPLCIALMVCHLVYVAWMVVPAWQPVPQKHWMDVALTPALGVLWCTVFWSVAARQTWRPQYDLRPKEVFGIHAG